MWAKRAQEIHQIPLIEVEEGQDRRRNQLKPKPPYCDSNN